jgi:thioredoxin reductase
MIFGVPMLCNTEISGVVGDHKVEGVILARTGDSQSCAPRILDCDAVIFSGDWVPEAALARAAGIRIDTEKGGPRVDANYRTDSPFVYAAGNVLRGARSAGFCALEGRRAVRAIVADLAHQACQRRGAEYPAEA